MIGSNSLDLDNSIYHITMSFSEIGLQKIIKKTIHLRQPLFYFILFYSLLLLTHYTWNSFGRHSKFYSQIEIHFCFIGITFH